MKKDLNYYYICFLIFLNSPGQIFRFLNIDFISKKEFEAFKFAFLSHKSTNHKYDNYPYWYHLLLVRNFAKKFSNLVPFEKLEIILMSCWNHDVIEDARKTYRDVEKSLGKEIAEIVYALTNEKGKNRDERAGDKYYNGIKKIKYADFVKICDRLANVYYSKEKSKSKMVEVYRKEKENFKNKLYKEEYKEMFNLLEI